VRCGRGGAAVDVACEALRDLAENLPAGALVGDTPDEVKKLVEALPQGRGRLDLDFRPEVGIGAGRLAIVALSDEPTGPAALGRLFADTSLRIDWQPGLGN
jgi:hypothetical protein